MKKILGGKEEEIKIFQRKFTVTPNSRENKRATQAE